MKLGKKSLKKLYLTLLIDDWLLKDVTYTKFEEVKLTARSFVNNVV